MKKIIVTLFIAVFVSCNSTTEKEAQGISKMKEVVAIHDEVMPKMGTLARLARDLNEKIEAEGVNPELEQAVKNLGTAKTQMMDWMRDFGGSFSADEILKEAALTDEKLILLEEHEVTVKKVRDDILNSISKAEELLVKK